MHSINKADTKAIILLFLLIIVCVGIVYLSPPSTSVVRARFNGISEKDSSNFPRLDRSKSRDYLTLTQKGFSNNDDLTLVGVTGAEEVLLLDSKAKVINSWSVDVARARLLPNCNLLVVHGSHHGMRIDPWKSLKNQIREYDRKGNLVWSLDLPDIAHHDVHRLENGSTLAVHREIVSDEKYDAKIRSDRVLIANQDKEITWSIGLNEVLDVSSCGWKGCTNKYEKKMFRDGLVDWSHVNTIGVIPDNKWYRAGDTRFRPGNIMIMARNLWTAIIVDKETKKTVWTLGGDPSRPFDLNNGIVRGHEAHMIPDGLPGAGNILVFDNGIEDVRPYSIVREVNPVTLKTVWSYMDKDNFFSKAGSSVQRLKNGNTLVSQDRKNGRVFEVNSKGDIVWSLNFKSYFPSRAHRYPLTYCSKLVT